MNLLMLKHELQRTGVGWRLFDNGQRFSQLIAALLQQGDGFGLLANYRGR